MCNCKKSSNSSPRSTPAQNHSAPAAPKSSTKSSAYTAPVTTVKSRRVNRQAAAAPVIPTQLSEIDGASLDEKRQTFAYMLGLEEPVSEAVLLCAVQSHIYAQNLMHSINDHKRLYELLNNPPYTQGKKTTFFNSTLIAKAGTALTKWAVAGFPTVSKATLKKREDACLACPELQESTSALQKITASSTVSDKVGKRTGNKSCQVCGCVITNKIRLATETCPLASPGDPAVNKWDEPVKTD